MQKIQEYTSFGKQVIYGIAYGASVLVVGIIQLPILTKALGSSQYGAWSLIITAISIIVPFVQLSFGSSIVRFLAAEKDANKIKEDFLSACTLVLLLGLIASSLFFLLSHFIAVFILKDNALSSYLKLSSILILLDAIFPVLLAFFRRESKIGMFYLLNMGLTFLQAVLTILFILLGYGLTQIIEAAILSTATMTLVTMYIIFKRIGFSRPKFSNIKVYVKWGLPLTPNSAIQWIINESDAYIVNYFRGISAAGIYNAAGAIGGYAGFVLSPLTIVIFPIISKTYDEGKLDECRDYFKYSFKYLMMFTIPAVVGLSILAKPLLRIVTTPEFTSGSFVVALAAFASLASCLFGIGTTILYLVGKTQLILRMLCIATVLNVILNVILVRLIGIIGAGLASALAYAFLALFGLTVSHRYFKFDMNLSFLIKSTLSSGIMALCIWLINPETVPIFFLSIVTGIITYFVVLILVRGFSKIELTFFISFIRNSFGGHFVRNDK